MLLVWSNSSQDIDGDRAERCNQRSSRAAESLGRAVDIYEDEDVGQGLLDGSWHLQIVDREILTTAKLMVNE